MTDEDKPKVWIDSPKKDDPEIFVLGKLASQSGATAVVEYEGKEHKVSTDKVWHHNPPILEGTDDLTSLSHMHEPGVLHNLRTRYFRNQIYSKSGPIFIAVNPFQKLPLYSDGLLSAYCSQTARQLPPHVYQVGDQAFQAMTLYDKNQSILVTGESGAGKTETTKILLQYFAAKGKRADESNIQDKVLGSTPILEAFGNAKTLRNDNSSRFGKFILVDFDYEGSIIGARTKTYLLEKSRLIHQAVGERNYHIFYQLCGAVAKDQNVLPSAAKWKLRAAEEYEYLNGGGDLDLGYDEADSFAKTRKALEVVGLTVNEIDDICTLLACILTLGNIKFYNNDKDAALLEPKAQEWLDLTTSLLGTDSSALLKAITIKRIVTGKDSYEVPLNKIQAEVARDSLAMLLYETLFLWLVDRINVSMKAKVKEKNFIGILDIYGFESFQVNSFEQFCINYANEKLQQQFNQFMFKLEQEEYQKEEIDWTYVKFTDNQPCIKIIEKAQGILEVLDEESKLARASPQTFATKLSQKNKGNPYYEKPRFSDHAFGLKHYPGVVEYDTTHFIDKNKNRAQPEFLRILKTCKFSFVNQLYATVDENVSEKVASVSAQFKDSLQQLMDIISDTEPNYIRCLKPNDSKKPSEFAHVKVLEQLRCNGVLEAIRIARDGFPTRYAYNAFWNRFLMLVNMSPAEIPEDGKEKVVKLMNILNLIGKDQYQCGKTKIFLKSGQLAALEERRTAMRIKSIVTIQKFIRGSHVQKKYGLTRNAALVLQCYIRMYYAKSIAEGIRRKLSATILQRYIRSWQHRKAYLAELEKKKSAIVLQKNVRCWIQVIDFHNFRRKVIAVQTKLRGIKARREYAKMKSEAQKVANILIENRSMVDTIQKLRTELALLSKESTTKQVVDKEEVERNEEERKALKAKVESFEEEISQKKEQIARLQQNEIKLSTELASWRQKQKDFEKEGENFRKEAEEAAAVIKAKDLEIANLDKEMEELERKMEELNTTIEALRKSNDNSAKQSELIEKVNAEVAEKSRQIEDLILEKENLKSQSDSQLQRMEEEKKQLEERKEEEKKQLEERMSQLKNQNKEEGLKWSQYELENQNLKTSVNELRSTLDQTKQSLEAEKQYQEKRIAQSQAESEGKVRRITQLESELEQLRLEFPRAVARAAAAAAVPSLYGTSSNSQHQQPQPQSQPLASPTSQTQAAQQAQQAAQSQQPLPSPTSQSQAQSQQPNTDGVKSLEVPAVRFGPTSPEYERLLQDNKTLLEAKKDSSKRHAEELDRLRTDAEHEKQMLTTKLQQLETLIEDRGLELQNARQENRKLGNTKKELAKQLEDIQFSIQNESREKKNWHTAYEALKEDMEKKMKDQIAHYSSLIKEQREKSLQLISRQKREYEEKIRQLTGATEETAPDITGSPLAGSTNLKRVVTQRHVRRLSVSSPLSSSSRSDNALLAGSNPNLANLGAIPKFSLPLESIKSTPADIVSPSGRTERMAPEIAAMIAHPAPAAHVQRDVVIPEKKIAEHLSQISPTRYDQFKNLVEALLSESVLMGIVKSPDNSVAKSVLADARIPLPAFVLLRYVLYINHMDKTFLQSDEISVIPQVIKANIPKANDVPQLLVAYMNISSALLTTLITLSNAPISGQAIISITVDWMRRDKVDPVFVTVIESNSVFGQLQSVVCLLYGKLLRDVVKKAYVPVEPILLNPSATNGVEEIVKVLVEFLEYFREAGVDEYLIGHFFGDVIRFLDISIFNQIILRKDLCSFSKAFQLKPALEDIERRLERYGAQNWISDKQVWFFYTKQILSTLTMDKKLLCHPEGRRKHCPSMSLMQLKQMCTLYVPEEFETSTIADVIMVLMGDSKFNFNDPLLFNNSEVKIDTGGIPVVDPTDLQNLGFAPEVVDFVLSSVGVPASASS